MKYNVVELFPSKKKLSPRNYNKNHESQEVYPFKNLEDIQKIKTYLLNTGYTKERYRNYLLFVFGINCSLRCGDLVKLKWEDIIENKKIKDSITVYEEKTKKKRTIGINRSIKDAINIYIKNIGYQTGYIFKSQRGEHITVRATNKILKDAATKVGIKFNVGTHSMRKTWVYHQLKNNNNDALFLTKVQDMLGHSTPKITLRYCGLMDEEFIERYNEICL